MSCRHDDSKCICALQILTQLHIPRLEGLLQKLYVVFACLLYDRRLKGRRICRPRVVDNPAGVRLQAHC